MSKRTNSLILFIIYVLFLVNLIQAENITKSEIQNKSLFDIFLSIPSDYQEINPGDQLLTSVKLVNLGSAGRIDVNLKFQIKDPLGKTILEQEETVAVETQSSFVRTFDIPPDALPGKYIILAKLTYADGKEAVSQTNFDLVNTPVPSGNIIYYGIIIFAIILILSLITYFTPRIKKFIEYKAMKKSIHQMVNKRLGK